MTKHAKKCPASLAMKEMQMKPSRDPRTHLSELPGASIRSSTHGKGQEEGGLAYAKA